MRREASQPITSVEAPGGTRTLPKQILEFSATVSGLPTLVAIVVSLFTQDPRATGAVAAASLTLAAALWFSPQLRRVFNEHSFLQQLPWVLNAVMVLALVLLVIPSRALKQRQEQTTLLASKWLRWQQDVETEAGKCKKGDVKCFADRLRSVLEARPRPDYQNDVTGQASDVIAGQVMLANDSIRDILRTRLGVSGGFIGAGFSEPGGQTDITRARTSEYLVPNLSNSSAHIWRWQLAPGELVDDKPIAESTLRNVLLRVPPDNHQDFEANWKKWVKDHLGANDPRPPLVRFVPIDVQKSTPSNCLGRPGATRVFMNRLSEDIDKKVADAAMDSGYVLSANSDQPSVKLFVWVYAPTSNAEVTPATWNNVLVNFGRWITDKSCDDAP